MFGWFFVMYLTALTAAFSVSAPKTNPTPNRGCSNPQCKKPGAGVYDVIVIDGVRFEACSAACLHQLAALYLKVLPTCRW